MLFPDGLENIYVYTFDITFVYTYDISFGAWFSAVPNVLLVYCFLTLRSSQRFILNNGATMVGDELQVGY